ncbi:MAG: guanylate kinase, partial [Myxococcota bacterium]
DGVHYHFVGRQAFAAERDAGALAEWAEVHRNFYATPKAGIARAFEEGQDVLFDIDYQGAEQLQQAYPEQCVSVLVVPPSMEELEERLRGRGTDPEEVVQHRLKAARGELAQHPVFDYIVVNDDFEFALQALTSIYDAARHGAHLHRRLVERMLG